MMYVVLVDMQVQEPQIMTKSSRHLSWSPARFYCASRIASETRSMGHIHLQDGLGQKLRASSCRHLLRLTLMDGFLAEVSYSCVSAKFCILL